MLVTGSQQPQNEDIAALAQEFAWFSTHAYAHPDRQDSSPLYAWLAHNVASDPEILALLVQADRNQQMANLLFAAVHFLLLRDGQDILTNFYPDLTAQPRPREHVYPHFRAFCVKHEQEIRRLVCHYRVQTNEVLRCTALLPAFTLVAQRDTDRPLWLIELGPSAGLLLLWDHYGYDYGPAGYAGCKDSPIQLHTVTQGELLPPLPASMPEVAQRTGIDLNPLDVHNDTDMLWLKALIWPEHQDRAQRIEHAIRIARQHPPTLIKGNALDELPKVLAQVPTDVTPCVYHSFAMNQAPAPVREQIFAILADYAQQRAIFRVGLEWYAGAKQTMLELCSYQHGKAQQESLAICESHGRWIRWLGEK